MAKWPDQRLCRVVEGIEVITDKNGTKHVKIKFMARPPNPLSHGASDGRAEEKSGRRAVEINRTTI